MVIGGAEIYALVLPKADRIELTEVHLDVEGDAWFPEIDPSEWREIWREDHAAEGDAPAHSFVALERVADAKP
jgi:dihydrofolate reductase